MKAKNVLTVLAASVISLQAYGDSSMTPGQWEYSTKMEMPGMPFALPAITFKQCLTQADVDKGNLSKDPNQKSDCEIKNLKQSEGAASYDFQCKGEHPASGHYDFTFTPTTLQGVGSLNAGDESIKNTMSAKRVGDCK